VSIARRKLKDTVRPPSCLGPVEAAVHKQLDRLYEIAVLCASEREKDCRVRVFNIAATGSREAKKLGRLMVNRLDAAQIEEISTDVLPIGQGLDPVEILRTWRVRPDTSSHAWTKEEIESDDLEMLCDLVNKPSLERAAHHEAGHAVLAYNNKYLIKRVLLSETGDGKCSMKLCYPCTREGHLLYVLAGVAAEAVFSGVKITIARMLSGGPLYLGGRSDFKEALTISREMHGLPMDSVEPFIEDHILYMAARVRAELVEPNWHLVKRLAAALLEKRRLSGDEVLRLCSGELTVGGVVARSK
jgi:hypothetical protein